MTASDVREKDSEAAEAYAKEYANKFFSTAQMVSTHGHTAECAFLAGIDHARSDQAQLVEALEEARIIIRDQLPGHTVWLEQAEEALAGWRKK